MKVLSVIIPVYNEDEVIVKNTEKLIVFLNKMHVHYEIILCDNGSTDETPKLGRSLEKRFAKKVKFIRIGKRGVGRAFKKAVLASSYENLISVDMDLSVDLEFIPKCLNQLKKYSIVIGSKISSQQRPLYRRVISKTYIALTKMFLGLDFSDYSIGAKGYRKDSIVGDIKKIGSGSFYVIALIYFAKQRNRKIVEIKTSCHDTRKSKFSLSNEVIYRLNNLLTFWFREKIIKRIIRTAE